MWNKLAQECHAENQHWWHDPATGKRFERNRGEMFALMHSELSECLEGIRKDLWDNHIPERASEEVELADFIIRLMDYIGHRKHNIDAMFAMMPAMHVFDNKAECINAMHNHLSSVHSDMVSEQFGFSLLLKYIDCYCCAYKIDLEGAIRDKRAFNRTRHDHTNEARLAAGGKKF